jgi:hypothetical protein
MSQALKGTLHVVTMILRRTAVPMSVREIVELAGPELPTHSKTPATVVARDLAMDIKKYGEASAFVRTAPGRFTLRDLVATQPAPQQNAALMGIPETRSSEQAYAV